MATKSHNEIIIKDIEEKDEHRKLQSFVMNLIDLQQTKLALMLIISKRINQFRLFYKLFPVYFSNLMIKKSELKLAIDELTAEINNKKMFIGEYISKIDYDIQVRNAKMAHINKHFNNIYNIALQLTLPDITHVDQTTKNNLIKIINAFNKLDKTAKDYELYKIEVFEALYNEVSVFI